MNCLECGAIIPNERLTAVPGTKYCVKCIDKNSDPTIARMIYGHKTAGSLVVVKGKENCRLLKREYERGR